MKNGDAESAAKGSSTCKRRDFVVEAQWNGYRTYRQCWVIRWRLCLRKRGLMTARRPMSSNGFGGARRRRSAPAQRTGRDGPVRPGAASFDAASSRADQPRSSKGS
ncbi:hypothetical protein OI25_7858 (plasmid) [Paraburkholderia fungorum]|uniref:Uncharacterized protein n=1 Tax=Paraburkholderia fungorum TaxID=134537 RepID=A0AAU8SRY3_9BURK|nr:hypothetical protein OI25_7858 [Paraburkholderia fungorum]